VITREIVRSSRAVDRPSLVEVVAHEERLSAVRVSILNTNPASQNASASTSPVSGSATSTSL
jgi:hypothetical protein